MATRWANFQASAGPFLQSALRTVQVAGFMVWFHDYLGVESMVVSGPSMQPTFNYPRLAGDIIFLERISCWVPGWLSRSDKISESLKSIILARLPRLEKGDVVVAHSPMEPGKLVCKRLAAIQGDEVKITSGYDFPMQGKTLVVPRGHVWLEGDNPDVSRDSREYGPVPIAMIYGRAWAQVWPPTQFSWISKQKPKPIKRC